jgi:hypothetical protein
VGFLVQALAAAHAVPTAWQAGEEALKQLPALQQRLQALQFLQQQQQQRPQYNSQEVQMQAQGTAAAWLNKIEEGLAGLGYAPRWDAKLLAGTLHGLSLVAASAAAACSSIQGGASDGSGSGSWEAAAVQRVSGVMLTLLRHHSPSVRQLVWQLLQSAVESLAAGRDLAPGGSSSPGDAEQSPVVRLLLLPEVLECLVVEQLNSADAKPAVCRLLLCMLRCWGSSVAQRLLTWRAWISSCAGDAAGDGLTAALGSFLANPADNAGLDQGWSESDLTEGHGQEDFWCGEIAAMLQDLFSTKKELRRDAGRQLLQVLVPGVPLGPHEICDLTGGRGSGCELQQVLRRHTALAMQQQKNPASRMHGKRTHWKSDMCFFDASWMDHRTWNHDVTVAPRMLHHWLAPSILLRLMATPVTESVWSTPCILVPCA